MDSLACEYPFSVFFWFSFLKAEYVLQVLLSYQSFDSCPPPSKKDCHQKKPQQFPSFYDSLYHQDPFSFSVYFYWDICNRLSVDQIFLSTEVLFAFLIHRATISLLSSLLFTPEETYCSSLIYTTNILSCGGSLRFTQLHSVVLGSLYSHMMCLWFHSSWFLSHVLVSFPDFKDLCKLKIFSVPQLFSD